MRKISMLLLSVVLLSGVVLVPMVTACDTQNCSSVKLDLKCLMKLACNLAFYKAHHVDLDNLLSLAGDREDCEDLIPELKRLIKLTRDPTFCEQHCIELSGLVKLACQHEKCEDFVVDPECLIKAACGPMDWATCKRELNHLRQLVCGRSQSGKECKLRVKHLMMIAGGDAGSAGSVRAADFPRLAAFLKKRVPVNARDSKGNHLLVYAAAKGNVPLVKALIAHGANVDCKNSNGCTPLACAKIKRHSAVIEILERQGAK